MCHKSTSSTACYTCPAVLKYISNNHQSYQSEKKGHSDIIFRAISNMLHDQYKNTKLYDHSCISESLLLGLNAIFQHMIGFKWQPVYLVEEEPPNHRKLLASFLTKKLSSVQNRNADTNDNIYDKM
ncbi:hypothetical protein CHS0354_020153 [Potamilus streckersoni]|uniref:Uncharacterized protein n=1 Tax=Potamilus streckersoni TaxID=2493646 RepID=A0AAE0VQM3_9BIVA|nr:hypothetical protein CHS0354_020153 [Potamilus streckersoni]